MKDKPVKLDTCVYAEWDGYHIKIYNADNYIELKPEAIELFEKFRMNILAYLVKTTSHSVPDSEDHTPHSESAPEQNVP